MHIHSGFRVLLAAVFCLLLAGAAFAAEALPRLVDVGSDKCVPCKMMEPVLAELEKEYAGRLTVEFVDAWKDPDAARDYRVQMIPTQIFFGRDGQELFRHSGFYAKEAILAKWQELGYPLAGNQP